jgi:hypothetical protein
LAWALVWNVRTCDSERRWLASGYPPSSRDGRARVTCPTMMGDPQAVDQQEVEYRTQSTGADRLVRAMKPGNAGRAKGAGCPGQPKWANHIRGRSSEGLSAAGHGCMDATSRVLREGYARFCERLGVRFPRPTRLSPRRRRSASGSDPPDRPREDLKQRKLRGAEYRCGAQGRTAW